MIYQCTKDMLKALKKESVSKPDIYSELFSWNVKLMKIGRRNLVYLMNDASKLSLILYGVTQKDLKNFDHMVKENLIKVLEDCGVKGPIIQQYIESDVDTSFCTSGSRKQVGVLNRATLEAEYFFQKFSDEGILQRNLCERQNSSIVKNDNGDNVTPKEVIKNQLEKAYADQAVEFNLSEIAIHMYMSDRRGMEPYLNIRNGSICILEKGTEEYDDIETEEDFIHVRTECFDFFSNFKRFSGTVNHIGFHKALDIVGHGSGAIGRIKDLLYDYPDIQKKWYEYKDKVEREKVKAWLEFMGLM